MRYKKSPGLCTHNDFVAAEWGEFVRYIEVAPDQYATRQVEVFQNGNVLRYDRLHWCDDFGSMVACKFSRKAKWINSFLGEEVIATAEFEEVWRSSQRSELWKQQVGRSRVAKWGAFHVA